MDVPKVAPRSAAFELAGLLDSPEIAALVAALLKLRVRGIERVRLHADLTILAKLAGALATARA